MIHGVDALSLQDVVSRVHLAPSSLAAYRETFVERKYLLLHDFLQTELAEQVARAICTLGVFETIHALTTGQTDASTWEAAPAAQRAWRYGALRGTTVHVDDSPDVHAFQSVVQSFDTVLKPWFEDISQTSLGAGRQFAVHRMVDGDFMWMHDDSGFNRLLACNLYMSDGWCDDLGGELAIETEAGCVLVPPVRNSLVVFYSHLRHGVRTVHAPNVDYSRVNVGCWYQRPEAGGRVKGPNR